MIQINDNLLQEIGLGALPEAERRSLLNHIYETLELRVGMRLADQMTNEQLDEFERYFEAKDDKGAFTWLETNFPNYKDIVQQEFDKLKAEVAQSAPHILNASTQVIDNPLQPAAQQSPATDSNPIQQPLSPQIPPNPTTNNPAPLNDMPPQPPAGPGS